MSFNEKISYPIGGKQVQGGLPAANQILQFNAVTNQWEFVAAPSGQTFARVVKKTDQVETGSNASFFNDDELVVQLADGVLYGFLCLIKMNSPAVQDFKYRFAGGDINSFRLNGNLSSTVAVPELRLDLTVAVPTDDTQQYIIVAGNVTSLIPPFNFIFQWGSAIAGGGNTTVFRGSYLIVWQELP